ncbi:MAG: hormogonium polysaccharide biosynthesis glycosyltransferase HpsE [Fischerella sp. CENA71]|nr:hormogonium polysaccharide biosynthesis glycosyltransferase HpsE [Fischerella sp. CENA71]
MNNLLTNKVDFTVAIPTYNGEKRLPNVLEHLLNQTGVENLNWEIIIVDNNSSDQTAEVISHYQNNYNGKFTIKYFQEKEQGIAFARQRAVTEAKGDFIAFLDDDNLPANDWILQSYKFGQKYPHAGAWSGKIHGSFEVNPPENFKKIQTFLAIREHGEEAHLFDANTLRLPPGAALVVRKQAWCESVPKKLIFKGRLGKFMISGDDTEVLLYIHKAGWQIWYNPAMHVVHQIPSWRLERDYLLNLAFGCGLCIFHLRLINSKCWEMPIVFMKTIVGNLRRILHHVYMYRGKIKSDIIVVFEIRFYFASMLSPFYFIKCFSEKYNNNKQ